MHANHHLIRSTNFFKHIGAVLLAGFFLIAADVVFAQQSNTHTVKKGETLFSIAQKYELEVSDLKEWNDLQTEQLHPGQILRLRPPNQKIKNQQAPDEETSDSNVQEGESGSGSYYEVKSGDTLYEIARKHDMSVNQLKSLNNLTSNNIQIGQRLLVRRPTPTPSVANRASGSAPQGRFVRYTVQSGEDLSDLTQQFEMDSVELAGLNPEINLSDLQRGEKVTVLKPATVVYQNPYRIDAQLNLLNRSSVTRYPEGKKGATTTSGELYNPKALTAAHASIALGSIIYIENPHNRRGLFVKVNDRVNGQELKLSARAYELLNFAGETPTVKIYQRP